MTAGTIAGFAPGRERRLYAKFIDTCRNGCTRSRDAILLLDPSVEDIGDMLDLRKNMDLATLPTCSACAWAPRWPERSAARAPTGGWRRCSIISRNMSARPRTNRRPCCAASRTCRRDGGRLVSARRNRAVPAALARAGDRNSASTFRPAPGFDRILCDDGPGHRRRNGRRRDDSPSARSFRTWTPSAPTANCRRQTGGASSPGADVRAGLFRRGAVSRPGPSIRTSRAPRFRLLRRSDRRNSTGFTAGASRRRTRLATSRRQPAPNPASRRRAARRCTSWCTRRICGRTMTGSRCSRRTAASSSTN